jgi:hypothetical protein
MMNVWRRRLRLIMMPLLALSGLAAPMLFASPPAAAQERERATSGLQPFRSDPELRRFLRQLAPVPSCQPPNYLDASGVCVAPPPPPAPAPVPTVIGAQSMTVTGNRIARPNLESSSPVTTVGGEEITNVQEAGVDEGGIVKTYHDMLVILRRGRLFTVSLANRDMRPIDSIYAFPPGVSGQGDWYDEMLISGDRVIVIGYSYARGGTEINRFRISPDGRLRFEDAYHLRSNDYYSSRNYASRLIGSRLIYYTPLGLGGGDNVLDMLPGVRKWQGAEGGGAFHRIADARHVYIAPRLRRDRDADIEALHSVISCDLAAAELDCDATAVLGPESRTFYVSPSAVYLWIASDPDGRNEPNAYIYRLPLDGSGPSAVGARGMPTDQFSFREDPRDGRLNVLVRAEGSGDSMWRPEVTDGGVALLQVPLREFGDGSREAPVRFYRDLPYPDLEAWNFQNRFVGNHVLYGGGASGNDGQSGRIHVAEVRGTRVATLPLRHQVERIEMLGSDALVVGAGGRDLGFSSIELGRLPRLGDLYVQENAAQGENRSHAFFFNPDLHSPEGASGTMGLPVARPVDPAYRRFFGSAAAMLFLRRDERRFSPAGELTAQPAGTVDDGCQASCVDWYGNARPIFWRGRIFALLGYELVEGQLANGRIRETARTNFAPRVSVSQRREQ